MRTFNTFLRGCQWTANSSSSQSKTNGKIGGGVISSEEAWSSSREMMGIDFFDSSSYEYSIILLCQALRIKDAEQRIQEMMQTNSITSDADKNETLAIAYVALARAYALMGEKQNAQATAKKALLTLSHNDLKKNKNRNPMDQKGGALGGKRAWRNENSRTSTPLSHDQMQNRSLSNQLYRGHRKSELMREAESILNIQRYPTKKQVAFLLTTRLLYFGGGGTTDLDATTEFESKNVITETANVMDIEKLAKDLMHTLWFSYGLASLVGKSPPNFSASARGEQSFVLSKKNMLEVERLVGIDASAPHLSSPLTTEGWINFAQIFSPFIELKPNSSIPIQKKPIYIELGAGSGDWIISQANANPDANYISVELRADRVGQTFGKAILNANFNKEGKNKKKKISPLMNLCCCGSECGTFLREHIPPQSISRIYVNHPEPPTQTGSDENTSTEISSSFTKEKDENEEEEPAHMLNSSTLNAVLKCLKINGQGEFIIVTDNRWYANLICKTVANVIRKQSERKEKINFEQKQLTGQSSNQLRAVEIFPVTADDKDITNLILYEGQPCPAIGHVHETHSSTNGASYFDRLWRTGAGRHAEVQARFIIALQTSTFTESCVSKTSGSKDNACDTSHNKNSGKEKDGCDEKEKNKKKDRKKKKKKEKRSAK